jgi:hypothetical protein
MRPPLSQIKTDTSGRISTFAHETILALLVLELLPACAWLLGCGGGSSLSVAPPPPPPPPPPSIGITVTPTTGSVLLGSSQTLTARVTNSTNTSVTWSVNGVPEGSAAGGTITTGGVYTAPADLPSQAIVQVTATSQADPTKSASSELTITSDIGIALPRAGPSAGRRAPRRVGAWT